ncbi:hypothetical protein KJK34_01120 [Flavobacterium sp. D11R37]|uniref:hypothetical protein n=1 Tax=Flavobacterium coralii TaxID=2838017 RepID=UPI001CA648A2|nr:hypothetical protein [Flavobacterium coralii]MBY8961345.1 hypothetical protein [Flavobacterium coralii]
MKTKLFSVVLFALLFISCSDDDRRLPYSGEPLEPATWQLVNVSGSIAGIDDDFEPGAVKWTFNTDNTVTVVNNNTDEAKTDFFDSGNYTYGYVENTDSPEACQNTIKISNIDFGCVNVTGNTMRFTQPYADGYILTFEKI